MTATPSIATTTDAAIPVASGEVAASGGRILAAGIVHALAWWLVFPPIGWWWLAFVIPVPLVWGAVRARRRRTLVWAFGVPVLGAWLVHQWWVGAVSGLGLLPMCLVLGAWTPIMAIVLRRLGRSPRLATVPLAVLVPLGWVLVEELRGEIVLDGYPWYLLGQPLVEWPPFAQPADLGGVLLLSILPASIGGLVVDHLLGRGSTRTRVAATAGVATLAVAWTGYGLWRIGGLEARPGPTVLALQTNLPQSNKVAWPPEAQWRDANGFAVRTVDAFRAAEAAGEVVDLVVWPETMLPGVGLEPASTGFMTEHGWWPGDRFARLATELQSIVARPLLLGSGSLEGLRLTDDGESLDWDARFNSVYLLGDGGLDELVRYDKMFLTPFGETMPYISAWPWLESQLLAFGARGMRFDLVPGASPVRFEIERRVRMADAGDEVGDDAGDEVGDEVGVDRRVRLATPICFEDTVPEVCRRLVHEDGRKVVDLLVNASNDGWFGDHEGARGTHLQLARLRCIENRVPMVRAVNTGRSAWIDANGVLVEALPSSTDGVLVAPVVLDDRRSPFARLGRWPVGVLSAVAAGLLLIAGAPPRADVVVETEAAVG